MKRRVVVTGLGAITPIGNTVPEFWENLKKGTVGIGKITKFDSSDFKVKLAAEVKNFDPTERMDKKASRRMESFSQYAVAAAKARKADVLLCDTAGRLHNKKNLMEELKKINRVIDREYPDAFRETLVVLDATTGQNALAQAKEFNEVTDITGIVLTKMDGTAKGGIAVAIQAELGIPVKYIGVGETIDDLQKFDSEEFVKALFYREEEKNDDIGEI